MSDDWSDSDAALLARARDGDQRAAGVLVRRVLPQVLALAERMMGQRADAEDVVQESFARLWSGSWRPGRARLSTWLYTVTLNLCRDRLRRRKRFAQDDVELEMMADGAAGPAEVLSGQDTARAVRDGLALLPERQRAVLILRHYHDMSTMEIARCLSVSVGAAESLLARAAVSMRRHMESTRP